MAETLVLTASGDSLPEAGVDAWLVPTCQDSPLTGTAARLDTALDGLLAQMREGREWTGEPYQVAVLPALGRVPVDRIALVGLGKTEDCTATTVRRAAGAAGRVLGKKGLSRIAVDVRDFPVPAEAAAVALAEGAELSRYVPDPYRTGERRDPRLQEVRICGAEAAWVREGSARGRAKNFARDLVNEPGNCLDAPELARRAEVMAAEVGLECEVLDAEAMRELGMGAILTVARGSDTPPRLIVLRHRGREGGPRLALVGKAVTFDTGGISIKPAADMGRMKGDMAGGAAVLGAMRAIAELQVALDVVGIVPAADNMPSGRAWKPGDVVTTMAGKTVETMTTDAEGRMLLADGVCYARRLGATHVVDIATLTGACVVALGHVCSGLYGTDEELVAAVRRCGEAAGERHWPMPLFPEYRELIRSEIADLKNSGGRAGGSVTAAWFIREFAGDTPWAHLDIAGSSQYEKPRPWAPAGPTGTGVGTFLNLALELAAG